jgi:hypothetical protein
MWTCEHCGTATIVPTLDFCPNCKVPRNVAAEPEQPADGNESTVPVGSLVPEAESTLLDESAAASSPPKAKNTSKADLDWGKS